jgi:hypothetical protein
MTPLLPFFFMIRMRFEILNLYLFHNTLLISEGLEGIKALTEHRHFTGERHDHCHKAVDFWILAELWAIATRRQAHTRWRIHTPAPLDALSFLAPKKDQGKPSSGATPRKTESAGKPASTIMASRSIW